MVVVTRMQGLGNIPNGPTSWNPRYQSTITAAQRSAGGWVQARPTRGLGAGDNGGGFGAIPTWVWAAGGGLLGGALLGALIWRQ